MIDNRRNGVSEPIKEEIRDLYRFFVISTTVKYRAFMMDCKNTKNVDTRNDFTSLIVVEETPGKRTLKEHRGRLDYDISTVIILNVLRGCICN
jgi:hypothetical protein